MKTIAIIPARGGSKGIPGKNILEICGKPLIDYSIESALQSENISEIWVSSDDDKILKVARKSNEVLIHQRKSKIAKDNSSVVDTIKAILAEYTQENIPDAIILLQPTSPIRDSQQIDEAISLLEVNPNMQSLISVCPMDDVHPARMYWKNGLSLEPILEKYEQTRRQEIPLAYYRNGSMYIVRTKAFLENNSLMVKPSIGFEMPESMLLNIDTPRDVLIAEPLIKAWRNG
jgi:CMP-N,N'-diacetyllegionaminic acid synthase